MPKPRKRSSPDLDESVDDSMPETPPAPDLADSPVDECEDTRDFASYDTVLGEYIEREQLDETSYRASLYQYDKVNKSKQHLIDGSVGSILSPHDVGMAFGSGEYRYVVTFNKTPDGKPRIKAFRFNIGQPYDLKRALNNPPPLPSLTPSGPTVDPITQAMQIVGAIMQLQKSNERPPAPATSDPVVGMAQSHVAIQAILQQSSMQYIEFMKETRRRMMSMEAGEFDEDEDLDGEDEDMEQPNIVIEQLKQLAIEYLPKIMGDGLGSRVAVAAVRATPEFKRVVKDGPKLSNLLDALDAELGKEKVDAACVKLKIKRPG